MKRYEINENNTVVIYENEIIVIFQPRYPDGTEWTYEQAEDWAIKRIAYSDDPENNLPAPDSPLT